jgi:DNA mismatch repair protein MutL
MPIRVLPPDVAARIAAGEVIERPASIVKELVENSLDAGATRISVEITGGGITSIRVSDDGCGIEPDELVTAFGRHATSKLEPGDDLSRILTLGFRGEALPSVAAVGEVEVVSRPPGGNAAASLRIGPDLEASRSTGSAAPGTAITVRNIFANQPARRKFLRSAASESNAVAGVVTHYALAYPEVRISLTVDGRQSLSTSGSGDLRDAVSAVYGAEVAAAMLPVSPREGPIAVHGLTSPPHISRAGRGYISLFVNRRWIQNRRLASRSRGGQAMLCGRHPIAS